MSSILQIIGKNLKFFRKNLRFSQERLAEIADLHRTYIGAVERGEKNISSKNIEKLAKALGIEPSCLLDKTPIYQTEKPTADARQTDICSPVSINPASFNQNCVLPYGLKLTHVKKAMEDFIGFLGFLNRQLHATEMPRLESFLMPANFSSIVGEFMNTMIPKYCSKLIKNQYHNGHPDLIPAGRFPEDSVQYSSEGIEIKGSRHGSGWQGHNPESVWLMVFYFDSNTANDQRKKIKPKPFKFKGVYAARLEQSDWTFSGRSATSRRTITASVNKSGVDKMKRNWVYSD